MFKSVIWIDAENPFSGPLYKNPTKKPKMDHLRRKGWFFDTYRNSHFLGFLPFFIGFKDVLRDAFPTPHQKEHFEGCPPSEIEATLFQI